MELELEQALELLSNPGFRAAASAGVRTLFARNPDMVQSAISATSRRITDYVVEPALERWTQSETFGDSLARCIAGERDFVDELVSSFVNEGEFEVPGDPDADAAKQVLAVFFGELVGALLRSDDGRIVQTNRLEHLNTEAVHQINRNTDLGIAGLNAQIRDMTNEIAGLRLASVGESQAMQAGVDPQHDVISSQIDTARELILQSKVRSARALLLLLAETHNEISVELEFRLSTNLGVCELALDDDVAASIQFARALELQPDSPLALANASIVARLQDDLDRAETLARGALIQEPEHSQAGAALIEALHAKEESGLIEETLQDRSWMMSDETCRLTIARVWADQNRFDDALELCRQITEENPLDIVARLTLAHCLLSAAQMGKRRDTTELCREVVEYSSETWKLLEGAELEQPFLQVLAVRGAALAMLGSIADALDDFDGILRRSPGDSIALLNKGLALCSAGRFAEGSSAFEQITDTSLRDQAVLPHAAACMASEKPMEAVVILRGSFSLEIRTWEDVRRAEMLANAERAAGSEDTVRAPLSTMRDARPNELPLMILAGSHALSRDETEAAEKLYRYALDLADDEVRPEVIWRLANCCTMQGRYREAAELTKEVVNGDVAHEGALPLLLQLRNSGDVKGALAWARRIREEHPEPAKFVLLTEADVLTFLGDAERAADCWRDVCERADVSNVDRTSYAQALLRTGSRASARKVLQEIRPKDLRNDHPTLMRLANLKMLLGEGDFLEDAYNAWRYGIGDSQIHLGYFSMFMSQDSVQDKPRDVGPGCSVLVREGSKEEWWHILDDGEERRGEKEFLPTEDGAESFLGRKVGETVVLRDDVEQRSWEVAAIQSKYVRAFQEIAADFSTRFPSSRELSSVSASPNDQATFLGIVDERDRFVRDLEQLYRGDRVPFASICGLLQRPAPEVWRACTQNGTLRVRFAGGSQTEAQRAAVWLHDSSMIVLDMLSLLTIHELALGEVLRSRFQSIRVPQSVIDEVRQMVSDVTVGAQPGGYVGRNVDGSYRWVELSNDQWRQHQEFARSLLEFAESFTPIAEFPAADAEYESIQQLREILTDSGAGAIFAGDEGASGRPLLVSDDLGLAELANSMEVPAVNSQAVLLELRRCGLLSALDYSSKIAELAGLNYRFVRLHAADLQRLLEANGYFSDERTRALAKSLEGPECTKDIAVAVISDLIADLATRSLPAMQQTLLVSMFLSHLQRGRETTMALRECYVALEEKLPSGVPARSQTLSFVATYIKVANG